MNHFSFSSLRVRLFLLVLLAVLPALGLVLYNDLRERRHQTVKVQDGAMTLVRVAAADQARLIESTRQFLVTLAQNPAVRGDDLAACNAQLAELLKQSSPPLYATLGKANRNGEMVCHALPFDAPVSVADRAWFKQAVQKRAFAVGDYQDDRISKKPVLAFGYPLMSDAGQVLAVISAGLDLARLNRFAAEAQLPSGSVLTVVDRSGTILARNLDAEKWVGKKAPESPIIKAAIAGQDEGTAEATGVDGVQRLYAFASLPGAPGSQDVYVSIGSPTEIAYAEVNRALVRNLIVVGVVLVIALVVGHGFAGAFILRQVKSLVSTTEQLAAGNLKVRTELAEGQGEFGQLSGALDLMAGSLERIVAEHQRAEATVKTYARQQAMVAELGQRALAETDLSTLMSQAVALVAETLAVEYSKVLELLPDGSALLLRAGVGWKEGSVGHVTVGVGTDSQAGYTLLSDEPVIVEDLRTETRFSGPPLLADHGVVSGMSVIIRGHERPFGVLGAHTTKRRTFTQDDVHFLQAVANMLAAAIGRKQAEEGLGKSQAKNRALVDAVPDMLFEIGRDGTLLDFKPGRGGGPLVPPSVFLGKKVSDVLPTDVSERVMHYVARTLDTHEMQVFEYPLSMNGKVLEYEARMVASGDEKVLAVVRDITERKRAEEALRESSQFNQEIISSAQEGIIVYDRNLSYVVWNPFMEELSGVPAHEVIGKHPLELFPFLREQGVIDLLERGLAGETLTSPDLPRSDPRTGRTNWVSGRIAPLDNTKGEIVGVIAIVRDITERKQAEQALQEYTERLKTLREIDQAILVAESPEAVAQAALGRVQQLVPCLRVSVAVYDLEAREATVLAVQTDRETQFGAGARVSLKGIFGALEELQQGKVHIEEDLLLIAAPSRLIESLKAEGVRSYTNIPLVAQGELIGALNLGADKPGAFTAEQIDIAREVADQLAIAIQQARLREQLERHAAELEERVKERTAELWEVNAELESFAYTVTHDLRAPLRAMQGFGEALLEDCSHQLDSVGQDYAHRIVRASQRLDALICDLLAYSRLSRAELEMRPVSLKSVVVDVLGQMAAELQERDAQVIVPGPLPEVTGHRITLGQVITNLLTNAVKFVSRGAPPQVQVWAEERDRWVRLWIEDNGIGIAPEHHERIFRVFERLHGMETYPGTGIGLAIVRKGVERMGGRVGVESEVGKGSRFWLELQKA
jgi:PAS domain S-box-containing protein